MSTPLVTLSGIGKTFTMKHYLNEAHVGIVSGTGAQLLETALQKLDKQRRVQLALRDAI